MKSRKLQDCFSESFRLNLHIFVPILVEEYSRAIVCATTACIHSRAIRHRAITGSTRGKSAVITSPRVILNNRATLSIIPAKLTRFSWDIKRRYGSVNIVAATISQTSARSRNSPTTRSTIYRPFPLLSLPLHPLAPSTSPRNTLAPCTY